MNKEQYYKLFETDENDAFVRLIIPANDNENELNLIVRRQLNYF